MSAFARLCARAHAPVDIAGLAAFRVLFGAIMLVDLGRYWIAGWIDAYYLAPAFLFHYPGFWWVHPLPAAGMYALFVVLIAAAVALMVGLRARLAAGVLALGQLYLFLLSATHYLNHAYLLVLVSTLMAFVPADRALSIDAWRRPSWRRAWAPAWSRALLLAQLSIVYVFGGIAKINPDWLAGEPLRGWMRARARGAEPWLARVLTDEFTVGLLVQGGLWFDLLVAPALLWRRTRMLAVVVSAGFHLGNAFLFNIGVFPWFMLAATTLFFAPDWPRRLPWLGPWLDLRLGAVPQQVPAPARPRLIPGLVGAWLLVQLLLPLRHHLYPGDVAWTEQGHYFAWRMKLRNKSGSARFVVYAPRTRQSWVIDPADELDERQIGKMVGKPDHILEYAHHLADRWRHEHGLEVEVRAQVNVSLNRRPRQPIVDPEVDLAAIEPTLGHSPWIMPGPTAREPRPR